MVLVNYLSIWEVNSFQFIGFYSLGNRWIFSITLPQGDLIKTRVKKRAQKFSRQGASSIVLNYYLSTKRDLRIKCVEFNFFLVVNSQNWPRENDEGEVSRENLLNSVVIVHLQKVLFHTKVGLVVLSQKFAFSNNRQ